LTPDNTDIAPTCTKFYEFKNDKKISHLGSDICMIVFVAEQRKNLNKSKYQNFVAFLPNDYTNFPILYEDADIKRLSNTFFADFLDAERKYINDDFEALTKANLIGKITKQEFLEAYAIFFSRTYQYVDSYNVKVPAFIPVVDLFNYKAKESNKVGWKFDLEAKEFQVYAIESIKKGGKIHIEYGDSNNYQLLYNYGFTFKEAPTKANYSFFVGAGEKQVIAEINSEIDLSKTLNPIRQHINKVPEDKLTTEIKFINIANELASLKALKEEIDHKVKNYPTNLKVMIFCDIKFIGR